MVKLEIGNTRTLIVCDKDVRQQVCELIRYQKPGVEHAKRMMPNKWSAWDGYVRLLKPNNTFPTGLVRLVAKHLIDIGHKVEITDTRVKITPYRTFKLTVPFEPRPYQIECRNISDEKNRGVYVMGTGAGKTLTAAMVIEKRGIDTLFVVPDTGLREQVYDVFKKWFDWGVSKDVTSDAPIVIANIDSLTNKKPHYFKRFNMLVIDEFHHSAARTYLKLNELAANCFWRYGFTGTNIRTDGTDMTMHGVLANVLYTKSASDLIDEGFLVPPFITIVRYRLHGWARKNYREAYDSIAVDDDFNRNIATIARTEAITNGRQVLILVRRTGHGELLKAMIGKEAIFISGSDSVEHRDEQKALFNAKKIRCIIATSVLGEGQDIPNIDVFINARMQKSEIETKQGIGRALRLADGAHTYEQSVALGKDKATVYDFLIEGNKHLNNHSIERITQYQSEKSFKLKIV